MPFRLSRLVDWRGGCARFLGSLMLAAVAAAAAPALAQEKFSFGLNWLPDAERGGFYQAEATGLYAKAGLEVQIEPGGPQANTPQLMIQGRLDGVLISSAIEALNYANNGIPVVAIAAIFQKNPQILMAHRSAGFEKLEDLRGKPIMISGLARNGYWAWLKARFGFTDEQIRPYTFNIAAFLANQAAIQQGFVTYEPNQAVNAGADPQVFLLADHGYADYSSLVVVTRRTLETRRDVVQRFLDASIEGWRTFLFADAAQGIALIKSKNDRLTDAIIENSMKVMRERQLVDGGDAATFGIGAMTEARWQLVYADMSDAGALPKGDYWRSAFELGLTNRRIGMAK